MKRISAGAIAGAIAGFLFPTILTSVLFFALRGRIGLQDLASRIHEIQATQGPRMPLQLIMIFLVAGFVLFNLLFTGLGAILGAGFARFVRSVTVSSIYLKALGVGIVLYLLVSSPRLAVGRLPDISILAATVVDSLIFSFLFVRWTKEPSSKRVDDARATSLYSSFGERNS